jgi:hypothetical protein
VSCHLHMWACGHAYASTFNPFEKRKGLGECLSPAPSPCTVIGVPACTVSGILPEAARACLYPSSCCSNIPGVWGQRPQLFLEKAREARSAFSPVDFWNAVCRPVAVGLVRPFCRRGVGRAGHRSIAFRGVDFARRGDRPEVCRTRSSQIVNYPVIPLWFRKGKAGEPEGEEGALMRCRGQAQKGLPSGSPTRPPRPRSAWRSTTCR